MPQTYNQIQIIPLTEGGSERNFYRLVFGNSNTVIYMNYTDEREENKFYYDIAIFLKKLKINVPEIYYKGDGSIFLEDLGDVHLYNLVITNSEDKVIGYYYQVIDQLLKLHLEGKSIYKNEPFRISSGFSYSLYRWESRYFLDNLIRSYFNIDIDERKLESDFHFIADILSKEEDVLIHRDCQSQNIMVKDDKPHFIDFQGLRYGLPEYDLASLLEDPYVDLSESTKKKLIDYYYRGNVRGRNVRGPASDIIYKYCAVQRLMQALGAYAFLGLGKGKKEFLQYIPRGLKRLKFVLEGQDGFYELKKLLG